MKRIYQYGFYACTRCQLALGSSDGELVRWKSELLLMFPGVWCALSIALWINMFFGLWVFSYPAIGTAAVISFLVFVVQRISLGTKEMRRAYFDSFDSMPKARRRLNDLAVVAVFAASGLMFVASAFANGGRGFH